MPTAFLFPGQASQTPDMRDHVAAVRPDLLELAARVVGEDPFPRVDEGTDFAQPAIFCASLAGLATLSDLGERPDAVAGHSLGELAALVAAGSLSEADGLALVAERGRLMQRAGEASGTGGMLAVLGTGPAEEIAARHGLAVANDNAPGQLVLSGDRDAIERAAADAREAGLKAMALGVAGAFHSPHMAPAADAFARAVDGVEIAAPRVPFFSCVTAGPVEDPAEIRSRLVDGLTSPVRWRQTLEALHAEGIDRYVETGPGKVLSRLVKRTLEHAETTTAEREAGARA
jgi:[acyl-carrier-protein] S-malonyltransferase